jgi:hypothetical protein
MVNKRTNFEEASEITYEMIWRNLRSAPQYRSFVDFLQAFFQERGRERLDDINTADLMALVRYEEAKGNRGVMRHKLNALRRIVDTARMLEPPLAKKELPRIKLARKPILKWWLNPEERSQLDEWLRMNGKDLMADYIEFVCFTGVRVEEALRFTPSHFVGLETDKPSMSVPGMKTAGSQKTLPMFKEAVEIAKRRSASISRRTPIFEISYKLLREEWQECREFLQVEDVPTATLRSLRRSFGRVATERGMPTEVLRDYYRHSDIGTTAGYLKLIGGYDVEQIRKWV